MPNWSEIARSRLFRSNRGIDKPGGNLNKTVLTLFISNMCNNFGWFVLVKFSQKQRTVLKKVEKHCTRLENMSLSMSKCSSSIGKEMWSVFSIIPG